MENSTRLCAECRSEVRRGQKFCSEQCTDRAKYRSRSRVPCVLCGGSTGYLAGSKKSPLSPTCNKCRRATGVRSRRSGKAISRGAQRRRAAAKRLGVQLAPLDRIFIQGNCASCRQPFTSTDLRSRFCSKECLRRGEPRPPRRKAPKWPKPHGGRIPGPVRRSIYERDGWVCQLCMSPVDRKLHYLDPMAATLDHIECQSWVLIPDDTPRNLRLAHRRCNTARGDDPYWRPQGG